ncbi:hypothetical protein EJB05_09521, partial [Eragrostis curvula]
MARDGMVAPLLQSSTAPSPRRNMFPFVCATLVSMTTILMAYNLSLMSGAELYIREDLGLSDTQTEVLVSCINVYMIVSVVAAGWVGDLLGRRATLVLANALLMAGALAMALGRSYAALMAALFVISLGCGFVRVVAPVYNAEISPASSRGVLSTLLDMFVNLGILLGYVSNYAFSGMPVHLGWRVMYAVGVFPPVLLAAAVLAVPESPQWLAMRGRHGKAHAVLLRITDTPAEAGLRLEEINKAAAKAPHTAGDGKNGGVWNELIVRPSASVRRVLVCVVGLQFFVHAVGTEAVLMYSPLVFRNAGMATNGAALGATVAVGAVKTCFVLVATLLSDRAGRRPFLLASAAGVAAALVSIALTLHASVPAALSSSPATEQLACVASVLAFVAAFSVGLGPMVATYTVEILPLRLRAQGSSLGMVINRATGALVGMTFISLASWITMSGCFFLYAGAAVAACVFVFFEGQRGGSRPHLKSIKINGSPVGSKVIYMMSGLREKRKLCVWLHIYTKEITPCVRDAVIIRRQSTTPQECFIFASSQQSID